MKLNLKISVFFILMISFSCRNVPENEKYELGDNSTNNPSLVKINLSGIEYEDNNLENSLISENITWGGG